MTVGDGFKLMVGAAIGLVFLVIASFVGCGIIMAITSGP